MSKFSKAIHRIAAAMAPTVEPRPFRPPELYPGVVPSGAVAPIAMDDAAYNYANATYVGDMQGFPGFSYLAQLATRAEYRLLAATMAQEITREWIEFESSQSDGTDSDEKIKQLTEELKRRKVKQVLAQAVAHDCLFGRAQIFIDIKGQDRDKPLVISDKTIKPGSLVGFKPVEAMWTTPSAYNALDPAAVDFYRPTRWYMMGRETHASRLLTVVTRELPDMLKPAFNFAGMSLSQLAEPYVNNWLRTRQAVADLVDKFSITALRTNMSSVLQDGSDGSSVIDRANLFNLYRSNLGLLLLDKDQEELVQMNVPLSGLDKLQAQSQEHMCSVSQIPLVKLTGISPTGLNATSDNEIRVFYDMIAATQESFWTDPLRIMINIVQLDLWGEIDPNITWKWAPLWQMSELDQSTIRSNDAAVACNYIDRGVLAPDEVRDQLANDESGLWGGLDVEDMPSDPFESRDRSEVSEEAGSDNSGDDEQR